MATVLQTHIRCGECNRRLADFVNEIESGQVILEFKCPKCGSPHFEVVRKPHIEKLVPPQASK